MIFANEYDIASYRRHFNDPATPNLFAAAMILSRLAEWTNDNSDGWCYWPKPCRSAAKLIETLETCRLASFCTDITKADLTKIVSPVKAFLTRHRDLVSEADHEWILTGTVPDYARAEGVVPR